MKRIGLFIGTLYGGGAERVVSRLTTILSQDYEVYLILCEDTYIDYPYSGTLINMDICDKTGRKFYKIVNIFRRSKKLKYIKKKYKLDAVISFLESPNLINVLSKRKECKTILSVRNFEFNIKHNRFIELIYKYMYKKADVIVPVSEVIKNEIGKLYGIEKSKMIVMYNPYDISEIENLMKEPMDIGDRFFFENGFVFCSMGRYLHQKGFWHLIKAFKMLHIIYPDVKLVIIGQGEQEKQIIDLVHSLKLEDAILLLGFKKNPYCYIDASDVYVLSSLFEGFPNALVEAMACGKPIVAVDCPSGPREILIPNPDLSMKYENVIDAEFGILVPKFGENENWDPNSFEEEKFLFQAMKQYYESSELRKKYEQQALTRARDFNYERARKTIEQIVNG